MKPKNKPARCEYRHCLRRSLVTITQVGGVKLAKPVALCGYHIEKFLKEKEQENEKSRYKPRA